MNSQPQVTISLSPLLEAYCRFVFNTDPAEKKIRLRKNYDIAKLIHSNVITSDSPIHRPFKDHPVVFILPIDKINHYALRYHFLYASNWGEQKIVQGIEYEFRRWIIQRFERGYEKGYSQKNITEAILKCLNVQDEVANYEAIKKIDYRNRKKTEETRFNELLKECKTFE